MSNRNSGRGGHHHNNAGGGGGGGASNRGGHNHHNHHNNYNNQRPREFHSRNAAPRHSPAPTPPRQDMKLVFKPLQVWRNLMKRYETIQEERKQMRLEYEQHRYEMEKKIQTKFQELLLSKHDMLKEKVEERNAMRTMEVEVKAERETLPENATATAVKNLQEREEEVNRLKESILDSLSTIEDHYTAREKTFLQEFSDEREKVEVERSGLIEKLTQQERRVDFEVQRFIHDMDFQWIDLERRLRFNHPAFFEQELMKTKHDIQLLSECVEDMENRHITQLEQMQQISNDCAFEKARVIHEYEISKHALVTQAKYEGVIEFLQGNYSIPNAEVSLFSLSNPNGDTPQFVAQLQASLLGEKKIPSFESSGSKSESQFLIDLRDRHEDLQALAWSSQKEQQFNWSLSMIQKIVSHYESQDMRVYEHVTPNQYVSRLVWCPNNLLYPSVYEGCFSMGHGKTKEEATENAVQWAYSYLQKQLSQAPCSPGPRDSAVNSLPADGCGPSLPRATYRDIMMQCSHIDFSAPIITSRPGVEPVLDPVEVIEVEDTPKAEIAKDENVGAASAAHSSNRFTSNSCNKLEKASFPQISASKSHEVL